VPPGWALPQDVPAARQASGQILQASAQALHAAAHFVQATARALLQACAQVLKVAARVLPQAFGPAPREKVFAPAVAQFRCLRPLGTAVLAFAPALLTAWCGLKPLHHGGPVALQHIWRGQNGARLRLVKGGGGL